jgi:hypothetical protein
MAWTVPKTYAVGDVMTAADRNTYERDNMNALFAITGSITPITGSVNASGGIVAGTGFTVSYLGAGSYLVIFATAFAAVPVVVATINRTAVAGRDIGVNATTAGFYLTVQNDAATGIDEPFNFVVHTLR